MVSDSLSAKPRVLALAVLISAMAAMAFRRLRRGKVCGNVGSSANMEETHSTKWFNELPLSGFALLSQVGCCLGGFVGFFLFLNV